MDFKQHARDGGKKTRREPENSRDVFFFFVFFLKSEAEKGKEKEMEQE